jgi:hypothetical protein
LRGWVSIDVYLKLDDILCLREGRGRFLVCVECVSDCV